MKSKQETLEEVANKIYHNIKNKYPVIPNDITWIQGFIEGAKWQAERMYSEEEVFEMMSKCPYILPTDIKNWYEKFKKNKI